MFESFPESVIQVITVLIIPFEDIADTQKFRLVSTFCSGGLILTEATFGIEKTQAISGPRNPAYGIIPKEVKQQRRCKAGFFLYTTPFMFSTVCAHAVLYLHTGSFRASGYQIAAETAVVWGIKAAEGELFAFSLAIPSFAIDYILGPFVKFIFVFASHVTFIAHAKYPCEVGAHIISSLIVYRYIINSLIVYFLLPVVVEAEKCPWLTMKTGYIVFFSAIILSLYGLGMWLWNINEKYNKDYLWKKLSGKQFIAKMWDEEVICEDGKSKDEERAGYLTGFHTL